MSTSNVSVPAPELSGGPRSALVVATSEYQDRALAQLRSPVQDARELADVLSSPEVGGFRVTTLSNPTERQLRRGAHDFLRGRGPDELLVVYLSCHGVQDGRGQLYFAASDTEKDLLASTGVPSKWLTDRLDECRAKRQVLILDCCFSGGFTLGAKGGGDGLLLEQQLSSQGRGRMVLTASREGEYSFEGASLLTGSGGAGGTGGEARNAASVFTAGLVNGLRTGAADTNQDGWVSVEDAYQYAFDYVQARNQNQTPQRWLFGGEGTIWLARNPAGVPVSAAPLPERLVEALEDGRPYVRLGAVNELAEWLACDDPARVLAASERLRAIAREDAPRVARAAHRALEEAADGGPRAAPKGTPVSAGAGPAGGAAAGSGAAPAGGPGGGAPVDGRDDARVDAHVHPGFVFTRTKKPDRLSPAAMLDAFAATGEKQWRRAALDRGLHPAPIPLRWTWTRRAVTGPESAAFGNADDPLLIPLVPGVRTAEAGTVREGGAKGLFHVYGGLRSGRTVVLGAPGSGKSDAAVLTLLRALEHRRGLSPAERANCPVPVLLSVVGWDGRDLNDWLVSRLTDDYRLARESAAHLVEDGVISLFLDGFDEMAPALRQAALREIDRHAAYRVILFSRPHEYEEAVRSGLLHGAAALELSPVTRADAVGFLEHCQPVPAPEPWRRLIAHLNEQQDSVVSAALDTPLTLTLMRDAFPDDRIADVDEMLVPGRFGSRDEVVEYLFSRLITVRYSASGRPAAHPSYAPEQVEQWLGNLAAIMVRRGERSIDWRRMQWWAPAWPRVLMTALVGLTVGVLGGVVAFGLGGYTNEPWFSGVGGGIAFGILMGIGVGTVVGTITEFRDPDPRRRGRLCVPGSRGRRNFNLPVGAMAGIVILSMSLGRWSVEAGSLLDYLSAALATLAVGGAAAFAAARVPAAPGWTILSRWQGLRSWALLGTATAGGLYLGLLYWRERHSLLQGQAAGIIGALLLSLIVASARPKAHADPVTDPHTSWRQERWFAMVCGTLFGLFLGLAAGLNHLVKNDAGVASLPFVVVGAAVPFGTAGGITVSDHWRTTLLFVQLWATGRFPLLGMRFLKDAYDHRILRAEGPRYQFRHALLQDQLARKRDGGNGGNGVASRVHRRL
ncbi:caspase family protein [Streptomyces sp. NPDC050617]|uniref:caspase, EACC1-associated type n=1 Tax=Streptomyces sp. NPDC050617 TaxID=3154628 RepID=UPI003421BA3A